MSAKIPKGWRVMRDGEKVRAGDAIAYRGKPAVVGSACFGEIASDEADSALPFIRRIRAPRKHRFDGMALRDVLTKLNDEWRANAPTYYSCDYIAPRFAREVRRRDAMRRARK